MEAVFNLIKKYNVADKATCLFKELVTLILSEFMEMEVSQKTGSAKHKQESGRTNRRNGYRERNLKSSLGTLLLKIPKLREGSYFPSFLERWSTTEAALVAAIQEAYIQGISTRKVTKVLETLGTGPISKSDVSRLCQEIDERVQAFLNGPLEGNWPILILDAIHISVHQNHRVTKVAVAIAVGVNTDGQRQILGLHVGPCESEATWTEFLQSLVKRGLKGVQHVTSDAHGGIQKAFARVFSDGNATWQRCSVHFMRNVISRVPRKDKERVTSRIKSPFLENSPEAAKSR